MKSTPTFKHLVYNCLESPERKSRHRYLVDLFLTILILLNGIVIAIETVNSVTARYGAILELFDHFSVLVFTLEIALRIWVSDEHPEEKYRHPLWGRLRFMVAPFSVIDLLAVLPFYLNVFTGIDLRFMRAFRLIKILRFLSYSPSIVALEAVLKKEGSNLGAALFIELILLFVSSVFMYHLEKDAQPEKFGSIPDAMWWSITALTTVGFGDVVPITPLGKLLAGAVMLIGIAMFALPAGFMASAFVEEIKGKNFLATWKLVARVPFLNQLNAVQIAEIAEKLKPRIVLPGELIFQKGDKASSMYFIVSGEVEVEKAETSIVLREGEFFGEMGLLYAARRNARVQSLTYAELLCLESRDFYSILIKYPEIRKIIEEEADKRKKQNELD